MNVFNRLFLKVYLTIVVCLILVVVVTAFAFRSSPEAQGMRDALRVAGGVLTAALADKNAPQSVQREAVERLSNLVQADLALYAPDGNLIATAGRALPPLDEADESERWVHGPHRRTWRLPLRDGRTVLVRPFRAPRNHGFGLSFMGHLALAALLIAFGALPVVRGITRRLERLQTGVEQLGAGDLTARVKVEGGDEIAKVAESFNRAASRIEDLVKSHKMLLANASHELRTPLTRLRMSVELLKDKADPARKAELEQDIAELNQLIDEILLSSRLDAMDRLETVEDVDLLALAAEEAAHYADAAVTGTAVTVKGDPRLLRRLIRNLLENAARHGTPPIEVTVEPGAKLTVSDHGPGIPESDRERIFEPFFRRGGAAATGAGLGLALVRQIARRHNGTVTVESAAGGGTAFVCKLPSAGS